MIELLFLIFVSLAGNSSVYIADHSNSSAHSNPFGHASPPVLSSIQSKEQEEENEPRKLLVKRQSLLSKEIRLLESRLIKLIQYESAKDPSRADLLRKSLAYVQSEQMGQKLSEIEKLVRSGSASDLEQALEIQKEILRSLSQFYEILESNSTSALNRQKDRLIREQIAQVEQLLQQQKGIRFRLDSSNVNDLQTEELELARKTKEMENSLAPKNENTDASKSNPSDSAKGQQSEKSGKPNQSSSQKDSIDEHLQQSHQLMIQTIDQLEQQDVEKADLKMEAVEKSLGQAITKLKNSLRQNREEEIESTLRAMEERFQRMLQMQLAVNKSTLTISKQEDLAQKRIQAFQISTEQEKIIAEADKALLVLQEEGTSRAISGTLHNLKLDMRDIVKLLKDAVITKETLALQAETAAILSELVKSVQQEQADQNQLKRQSAGNGSNQGRVIQRPLVQKLAELKIIRQLQQRINRRHLNIIEEMKSGSVEDRKRDADRIQSLAKRQKQLEIMTIEIVQGGE